MNWYLVFWLRKTSGIGVRGRLMTMKELAKIVKKQGIRVSGRQLELIIKGKTWADRAWDSEERVYTSKPEEYIEEWGGW